MKTGADPPSLLLSSPSSHVFSNLWFLVSFCPHPLAFFFASRTTHPFLSSDSIIESDCGVKGGRVVDRVAERERGRAKGAFIKPAAN